MKTLMIIVAMLLRILSSYGQQSEIELRKKIDLRDSYLKRSHDQKLGAYITLGCGAAALVGVNVMVITAPKHVYLDYALDVWGLGLVAVGCLGASLIQFLNSHANLKRANRVQLELNKPVVIDMGLRNKVLPYSVGVGIPIN